MAKVQQGSVHGVFSSSAVRASSSCGSEQSCTEDAGEMYIIPFPTPSTTQILGPFHFPTWQQTDTERHRMHSPCFDCTHM
ncbi:hypothetical protein I79_004642 [Cricetulus griseus]|uniref:Uncharacterized protein n=1 Tax=Cricetulus griseus TaxID=10029 RepID=G3H334_CRIGR|nr:hypothetical protein I79_004642 [Cricetulus griseus]